MWKHLSGEVEVIIGESQRFADSISKYGYYVAFILLIHSRLKKKIIIMIIVTYPINSVQTQTFQTSRSRVKLYWFSAL